MVINTKHTELSFVFKSFYNNFLNFVSPGKCNERSEENPQTLTTFLRIKKKSFVCSGLVEVNHQGAVGFQTLQGWVFTFLFIHLTAYTSTLHKLGVCK